MRTILLCFGLLALALMLAPSLQAEEIRDVEVNTAIHQLEAGILPSAVEEDAVACRPVRAILRGVGRVGKGIGLLARRRGRC